MLTAARPPAPVARVLWGAAALALGLGAALLPLPLAAGAIGLAVLGVAALIEPALAVVLMLAIAPLKTLIETEAAVTLPIDVGQLAFGVTLGLWAAYRVLARRGCPLPRTPVLVTLVVIMLGFGPSLFVAASPGAWLTEMLKWAEMALLVVVVLDLGLAGRAGWIAAGAVVAGALQAVIGLYEYMGGSGAPHLWIAGFERFRAFGSFGQPNPFSAFMGLTLPLAAGLAGGYAARAFALRRERDAALRAGLAAAVYALLAAIILGGLVASYGRGAWLGFGAAAGVMVFFAPRRRWQAVALLAAGGSLVAGLWFAGLVPAGIQARVNNAVDEFIGFGDVRGVPVSTDNFAIVERLAHWQAALSMAQAHPWLGVGLGNYDVAYAAHGVPSWPRSLGHAHNDYLNVLAETGLVGLTAYLAGWMLNVVWTIQALRQPDPVWRGLTLGLLGVWTHLAVHSVFDKLYVNNLFLHIGVTLGLLAVAWHVRGRASWGEELVEDDPRKG